MAVTNKQLQQQINALRGSLLGAVICVVVWTILWVHFWDFKDLIPEHKHIVELCEGIPNVVDNLSGDVLGTTHAFSSGDGKWWTTTTTCREYVTK